MQTLFSNPWKPLLEDIASLMISGIFGMDQTGNVTLNYDEEKITIRKIVIVDYYIYLKPSL